MQLSATPLVWLALAAVAPVEAPRPPATTLLRYRFTEGETVRQRIEQASTLLAVKGETRQKTVDRSETERRFQVTSVDEKGVASLRLSIDATRMECAFDNEAPRVIDSRKRTLPAQVAKAIGRPLADIHVCPDGSIKSIKPLLSPRELDEIPGKLGLQTDAANNLFVRFPAYPVIVGETWHDMVTTRAVVTGRLTQEIKILHQYRFKSLDRGIAEIELKTRVVTPVTEPSLLVQLIRHTATGTIRFDVQAGRVIARELRVDNTEIGFHGPDSSLRAISSWTEQLAPEPTAVSSR
jgi:hypothetical protein